MGLIPQALPRSGGTKAADESDGNVDSVECDAVSISFEDRARSYIYLHTASSVVFILVILYFFGYS